MHRAGFAAHDVGFSDAANGADQHELAGRNIRACGIVEGLTLLNIVGSHEISPLS
jgi:hypothetical protein